ncbi:MAG: NnrS family protein [Gammaproteobacteria bacterium]|nr:NnrS family protein [Gammaproteobacteria bacterium]
MSRPADAAGRRLTDWPILALGFRPFYLGAAVFAVVVLPVWIAVYLGQLQATGYLSGVAWHSHEMIFGFAPAVIAGFLLTAVRNWTSQPTPTGRALAALVLLWVAARILVVTGPDLLAIAADVAFLPAVAVAVGIPIWRSKNSRNYKILVVLLVLTLANLVYHLAHIGILPPAFTRTATIGALDIITILMAVVGGRVIPAFTANAIPGAGVRQLPALEIASIVPLVLLLVAGILSYWISFPDWAWLSLLIIAVLTQTLRWWLWRPLQTWRNPLLLMLPVAYVWIPLSLAMRALALVGTIPPAVAIHALTLGAISGLMLAMMMRSALGHTGRALAAERIEILAFFLVQAGAITRLASGFVDPSNYQGLVVASGILWSLAFAAFLFRYAPMLCRSRIDGKPG